MSSNEEESNDGEENNLEIVLRNPDGSIKLRNPHIKDLPQDVLYHLDLNSRFDPLIDMFGDVKFICMGGSQKKVEHFADEFHSQFRDNVIAYDKIPHESTRCAMYKIGPVLFVSYGLGAASISIFLHEIIKLMYHAKIKDPVLFKIGTCGGFGLDCGTVVITKDAVDVNMKSDYKVSIMGGTIRRPAILNQKLVEELQDLADEEKDPYFTVPGKTLCIFDFYEEQDRIDGAFCDYTDQQRKDYLTEIKRHGVNSAELQAIPFAAITHHAGIKAAIVCVTYVDKFKNEEVATSETVKEWEMRPLKLVISYIKRYLTTSRRSPFQREHGPMDIP